MNHTAPPEREGRHASRDTGDPARQQRAEAAMTAYPPERGRPGILARLAREDWSAMTAAARSSPNHVASLTRWIKAAREENPALDDGQAAERAAQLRADYYRRISAAGLAARKASPRKRRPRPDAGRPKAPTALSPMHPSSPQRWPLLARQQRPGAAEEEIARLAAELRAEHYRRIWETRRANAAAPPGMPDGQAAMSLASLTILGMLRAYPWRIPRAGIRSCS